MYEIQTIDFVVLASKVRPKRRLVLTPVEVMVINMEMNVYFMQAMITCFANVLRSSLQQPLKYE